jgi:RNA recognition motif-containing protein
MPQQVNAVPPGAPQMPAVAKNSRIFCNNLAWTVGGDELKTYFLNNGFRVTDANVAYFPDGRSKGWGIVNFENDEDIPNAVAQLHNSTLNVRTKRVNLDCF